ncbi:MAG: class I SAM-dependent methyltransferase [Bacteriovoracia bacterium]
MKTYEDLSAELLAKNSPIVIDLGCGPRKKSGSIGVDILPFSGVDIAANLEEGLPFIPDNSVDHFVSSHFLEHIHNFEFMMSEIHRTLKPGGTAQIRVPHFSNPYGFSDYTHKRFFGLYTFDYFFDGDSGFRRNVPVYNSSFKFEVTSRKLFFKSSFYLPHLFKKHFWMHLINSSKYMQSLYEDSFTGLVSCYEIAFELKAVK